MASLSFPCTSSFLRNERCTGKCLAPRCSSLSSSDSPAGPIRLLVLTTTRREFAHLLLSVLAIPALPSIALDEKPEFIEEYKQYANDVDQYSLLVPSNWIKGTGKATDQKDQRDVTAFFPANDTSVNVDVLITGLGADYTSMGSFGTVDSFGETLVNTLDRSWKKPPGQAARLVNSKAKDVRIFEPNVAGLYYVEYTLQQPGERKRHLISVIGMRFNGWYNRLYTVTGQYWDDEKAKYGPILQKSFKFA